MALTLVMGAGSGIADELRPAGPADPARPSGGEVAAESAVSPAAAGYFLIKNRLSQKCLTPWGTGDGVAVTQIPCDGLHDQHWLLDTGSVGTIRNRATGKCLDLWGNGIANAQLVFTYACPSPPVPQQQWRPVHREGQYHELRPYSTNKCLDLASDNTSDGAVIQQWGCNPGFNYNQQWALIGQL